MRKTVCFLAAFTLFALAPASAQTLSRSGVTRENEYVRVTYEERQYGQIYRTRWFATNIGERVMCVRVRLNQFTGASASHGRIHRLEIGARNVVVAEARSQPDGSYGVNVNSLTWEPGWAGSPYDCSEAPPGYD